MQQGVAPWRAVAAFILASAFFAYGFVHRVAPSVMVAELMREFAVGAAVLGNLTALYFWAYASLQIPVGVLLDRFGPRRLVSAAIATIAVGSLVFAGADSYAAAAIGRLLIGVGAAFSWVGCLTVATQMFPPARFPMLTGIGQTAGILGAIFGQMPLAYAIEAVGWRGTNLGLGALGLALALGFWLLVRDRTGAAAGPGLLEGLKRVAGNPQTWAVGLFTMSMTAPIQAFAGLWGVPYLQAAYGLDKAAAGGLTTFMFYGWIVGALTVGSLLIRVGRRAMVASLGGALATASLALALYLPGLPAGALAALFALHGLSAGVMLTGFVVAREQNPPWASGAAYGLVNTMTVGIGGVMQILIGAALDLNWQGGMAEGVRLYAPETYRIAFVSLTALGVAGVVAGACFKSPRGA